jgi:hypothetical protein
MGVSSIGELLVKCINVVDSDKNLRTRRPVSIVLRQEQGSFIAAYFHNGGPTVFGAVLPGEAKCKPAKIEDFARELSKIRSAGWGAFMAMIGFLSS